MSRRTRRLAAILAGISLALIAALGVLAQGEPADKLLTGETIVVPAGTTIDHDLYAFGSTVTITGNVNGDLVVAAARIVIDGNVTGDVLAAGSEITLRGSVGGDFRSAGAQLTILGQISEDAAVAASNLLLGPTGRIGQDILFTATQADLEGNVAGGISGSATEYHRGGTVGGSETVSLGTRLDQPASDRTVALALDALRQYIVVVLFGLAFLRFAPRVFKASVDRVRSRPLAAAGAGVVAILGYVAAVIAIVVLMILVSLAFGQLEFGGFVAVDVAGSLLAIFSLTFVLIVFSAFVTDAIVGLAIGRLVSVAETSRWAEVIRLAIGSALVVVLTSFPQVGGLVKLLVILVGLGAFCNELWDSRRRPPVAAPVIPVTT